MSEEITYPEIEKLYKIPRSSFQRAVDEGIIRKYRRGRFDLADVISFWEQNYKPIHRQELEPVTDWLRVEDLGTLWKLEIDKYGEDTGDPRIVGKWILQNSFLSRGMFHPENRQELWGAVFFIPIVDEQTMIKLVSHEMKDVDLIPTTQILDYSSPGTYDLYCASVIMREDKRYLLFDLLKSYFDWWVEQAPKKLIGKIWTRVISDEGEMLAIRLQMSPIDSLPGRVYRLDLSRPSHHRLIRDFQQKIKEKY